MGSVGSVDSADQLAQSDQLVQSDQLAQWDHGSASGTTILDPKHLRPCDDMKSYIYIYTYVYI